jgi:hypothetical protein
MVGRGKGLMVAGVKVGTWMSKEGLVGETLDLSDVACH